MALAIALAAAAPGLRVHPAAAQESLRIAAVVNDDVITGLDLAVRTRMAILSSSLPDTPEMRNRVARQVLRAMIDERLMLQEAARQNVIVQQSEVDAELTKLAERNGVTLDQFGAYLAENGVLLDPLAEQVRATIAWSKLVARQLRPRAVITEEDVDEVLRQAEEAKNQPQRRVSEVFLAVDGPAEEEEVRRSAERLIEQIRSGVPFSAVASQFSDTATAAVGGDVGWVLPGQLAPEVEETLERMQDGDIAGPVRAAGGYYILQLRGQRSISPDASPEREEVRRVLLNQRLELLARRYLRDLRRDAFVEIRV
ncbi:MAG TPA: peptidylprolyl isomerase [Alphaproteobacteria bacterium]|jgi:peptidyl-prolyl cis-trans isomerase SurA|nr:peptidylprolyl isomerase [Alphaproteobacteria bacterium]